MDPLRVCPDAIRANAYARMDRREGCYLTDSYRQTAPPKTAQRGRAGPPYARKQLVTHVHAPMTHAQHRKTAISGMHPASHAI